MRQSPGAVDWRDMPEAKESQIALRRNSNPSDAATWPELNEWFAHNIERWVEVFKPIVKSLTVAEENAAPALPEEPV